MAAPVQPEPTASVQTQREAMLPTNPPISSGITAGLRSSWATQFMAMVLQLKHPDRPTGPFRGILRSTILCQR